MKTKKVFCENCHHYPRWFALINNDCFAKKSIGSTYLRANDYEYLNVPMKELNKDNDCPHYIRERWWLCFLNNHGG